MLGVPLALLAYTTAAAALVQGDCAKTDTGLKWLASKINKASAISCRGQPLQIHNAERYWGTQYAKNASVVVYPTTREDVAFAMQASKMTKLGKDVAFVCGAHGQTNASSSTGFVIDLSWLNTTKVLRNVKVADITIPAAIAYSGGADWDSVGHATAGSNYTAVGARVGSVGVGGFSTGGGIGYLAGAYGYAIDRLAAMEVVLANGTLVNATKTNKYKDLFWALQGGGGQFGIVTKFYQAAAAEPKNVDVGFYIVDDKDLANARQKTVEFFRTNKDPFSAMYYSVGFVPSQLITGNFSVKTLLYMLRFDDPKNSNQRSFNQTFGPILSNLSISVSDAKLGIPYVYMTQLLTPYFPYGFRRGFYGPQTQNITVDFLANGTTLLKSYVQDMLAKGDAPITATWAVQYMFPGLNGHLPKADADTAWPHSVAGHQSLFSPAWSKAQDDSITLAANKAFNQLTYNQQARFGKVLPDFPNYISPGVTASRVYGQNVKRLIAVKEKYDPECRIHQGRVFASKGCVAGGWANMYAT